MTKKLQPQTTVSLEYPRESLSVTRSSYPNGQTIDYGQQGRPRYNLLPSNHPLVLAESEMRKPVRNTFKKPKTLMQQAGKIIEMTSKRLDAKKIGRVGR